MQLLRWWIRRYKLQDLYWWDYNCLPSWLFTLCLLRCLLPLSTELRQVDVEFAEWRKSSHELEICRIHHACVASDWSVQTECTHSLPCGIVELGLGLACYLINYGRPLVNNPAAGVDDEHLTYALTNWRSWICLARTREPWPWLWLVSTLPCGAGCSRCGNLDCPMLSVGFNALWWEMADRLRLCGFASRRFYKISGFGVVMCRRREVCCVHSWTYMYIEIGFRFWILGSSTIYYCAVLIRSR